MTTPLDSAPFIHCLPPDFLRAPIAITVVGAGGNGSQIVQGLARLHLALLSLGHPGGLDVTLYDDDLITEANIGRQLFSPADVGQPKSTVLIHRLNCYFGLSWKAVTKRFGIGSAARPKVLIGCVDSAAARREIYAQLRGSFSRCYWLDLGNQARSGQIVLGELHPTKFEIEQRLPVVTELFPTLLRKSFQEDTAPSCSLAEALEKQDLFINQTVASFALHLLWTLLRHGQLTIHGYFVNLESGHVRPLPIDPALWSRMKAAPSKPKPRSPRGNRPIPKGKRTRNAVA